MVSESDSAQRLNRPLALDDVLKEDQKNFDCLSCRVMGKIDEMKAQAHRSKRRKTNVLLTIASGASAFFGLSAYSYFSGKAQLRIQKDKILQSGSRFGMKSRHAGITTIAMTLFGMGFWRLVN